MRNKTTNPTLRAAFTLVELGVVLVIIGLLTGAVMVGQNIIAASELQQVVVDVNRYRSAVTKFIDMYEELPGDFERATEFWGRADNGTFAGDCAAPVSNSNLNRTTCSGDGNGHISEGGSTASDHERFRFWEHLDAAGFIEGEFTGVQGPDGPLHAVLGSNTPEASIDGTGFSARWVGSQLPANGRWFPGLPYTNLFTFGAEYVGTDTRGPAVTPRQAAAIDEKQDDGRPGYGMVQGWRSDAPEAQLHYHGCSYHSGMECVCRLREP